MKKFVAGLEADRDFCAGMGKWLAYLTKNPLQDGLAAQFSLEYLLDIVAALQTDELGERLRAAAPNSAQECFDCAAREIAAAVGKPRLDPAALDGPAQKVIVLVRMLVELATRCRPDGEEQVLSTITLSDCTDREQECLSLFIYEFTLFKQGGASLADDFMQKFQEYDQYIEQLGEKLRAAVGNGDELGAHNKQLREKVRALAARVEELECTASATKDELEGAMAAQVKALGRQLERQRAEADREAKAAHELAEAERAEQARLRALLQDAEGANAALSAALDELHRAGASRERMAQLAEEREMLERKLLSLENALLTEKSERERLAQQLEKVKARHERELEEQEAPVRAEIDSLRRMLLEAQEAALFADKRSDSTSEGYASPLELQTVDGDTQRASVFASPRVSAASAPAALAAVATHEYVRFEAIHEQFDVLKLHYEEDGERLKRTIRELREELLAARLRPPEPAQLAVSALGHSEVLSVRAGGTLTEEMINKLVRLQQHNRSLKSENRGLRERVEQGEVSRHAQLATVYTAALSFMVNGFM